MNSNPAVRALAAPRLSTVASVLEQRQQVLHAAYDRHPERFVHGLPTVAELPAAEWINPPSDHGATPVLQTPSLRTEDQLPSPNTL